MTEKSNEVKLDEAARERIKRKRESFAAGRWRGARRVTRTRRQRIRVWRPEDPTPGAPGGRAA